MDAKLPPTLSSMQVRMARAALCWGVRDLAQRAHVGTGTVHRFETGKRKPIAATVAAIRRAFEEVGVEFIDRTGVNMPGRTD
jgi:predicted transcriptional regulator